MNIYLPIADMVVSGNLLIIIGFLAGILSGLYGISGGMITGPALIFAGIPSYIAVGASSSQTVGTAFAGTIRNWNKNTIDIKIALWIFSGSFISSFFGIKLSTYLRGLGYLDMVIACTFVVVFGITAAIIYCDILIITPIKKLLHKNTPNDGFNYNVDEDTILPQKNKFWQVYSRSMNCSFNIPFLLFIGALTGVLSAILGIGGATILVPMLIYGAGLPFHIASGTALFQTLLSSINITFLYASYSNSVDIILFSTMLISSIFGVHLGSKIATKINSNLLKLTFAFVMTAMCIQFIMITFIKTPANLFTVE